MSILPPNKPQKTVDAPKNFFIYGATMNGKSYLAGEFPNPLFISTDGNAKANPYPSIEVRNIRGRNGKITESIIDQLDRIILELQTTKHTFETIIIDVIDDVVAMIEQYFVDREGVETIGDIGFGKGHAAVKAIVTSLAIDLKTLPLNVIYVSRINTYEEDNVMTEVPSLSTKFVNIINGNCDYMIQAKKVGKNYVRISRDKRKNYKKEDIDDDRILAILDTVTGAFEKSRKTSKDVQDKIVQKMEKQQEEKIIEPDPVEETDVTPPEESAPVELEEEKEEPKKEATEEQEEPKANYTVPYVEKPEPEIKEVDGMPVTTRKRPKIK